MQNRNLFDWLKICGLSSGLVVVLFLSVPVADSLKMHHAIAVMQPTAGSHVSGAVNFIQTDQGVKIVADIKGLVPGKHGFHIHEWGDCSAADGSSAGGHYNPGDKHHGGPDDEARHAGDLGNIEAQSNGDAHYERVDKAISLNGPHGIVGRAVIVHAGADDLKTQPTGDAGGRLACGVIGWAR